MIDGLVRETRFTSFDGAVSLSTAHQRPDRFSQDYALGYMDTMLAFAQKLLFPLANPDRVANAGYKRRFTSGRYFLPRLWYILYRGVRLLA
jgi:hypothetical protein